jgi:outer membrane protein assembly factor BamB
MAAVGGGLVVFHSGIGYHDPGQLHVVDALTGELRYKVDVQGTPSHPTAINVMPLLVPNPANGTVMAYCADPYFLRAVRLGPTSGTVLWTQSLIIGGQDALPTMVGDSIVLEGCAYDVVTGERNQFYSPGPSSITVTYDSVRRNIYISRPDSPRSSLLAYRYTDNARIDFLWEYIGLGVGWDSVAIGPDGKIYSNADSLLLEFDPDTGAILRSVSGMFATYSVPSLTAGMIWTNSEDNTTPYDLQTFHPARTLPGGNFANGYGACGAFTDGYFVMDHGVLVGNRGSMCTPSPLHSPLIFLRACGSRPAITLASAVS